MSNLEQAESPVVRAFVAVELPPDVKAALEHEIAKLRRTGAHVSWTAGENLHVTLVFLGDVPRESVARLAALLDGVSANTEAFDVECAGLGTFGSARAPRIVWAGIEDAQSRLSALQRDLAEHLSEAGFHLERRPFHAHITLGRVRSGRGVADLTSALGSDKKTRFGRIRVERLVLMRSRLEPSGAVYSVLHASPVKGAKQT